MFHITSIVLFSLFFGISTKIADLLNEHGLKWFQGSRVLFGVLLGTLGSLLILSDVRVAHFVLAIVLHWILRYRIDYLNHGIGATIILLVFLSQHQMFVVDWLLFLVIFVMYSIHGLLNDVVDRGEIKKWSAKYFESNSHYFTVPIILTLINPSYWIILVVSGLHVISYEATKYFGMKIVACQQFDIEIVTEIMNEHYSHTNTASPAGKQSCLRR